MNETDHADPVRVPLSPAAPWIGRLLWLFMFSFAFDYRASVDREASGGSGIDQLLFLALCVMSVCGILALGWRHLTVRPGAWMLWLWAVLIAFLAANAFLHGVDPGRSLRTGLPFGLCLAGMAAAHIAACSGLPASRIVAPVLAVACINIVWRVVHGFLFKEVSLESVRVEVLSPATNWLAAWIGCALLLRPRFHPMLVPACGLLAAGILITVTRALMFPVLASAAATFLCFALGCHWRIFEWRHLPHKLLPLAVVAGLGIAALGIAAAAWPALIERWNERLFHHAGDRNITMDVSWMTRRAEAEDIVKILSRDPVRFVHGMGIGASYTWNSAYLPELRLVYPENAELGDDVWFAGHSTWTYALFSGGVIGVIGHLLLFGGTAVQSLRAAAANAHLPGPDIWLAFLPVVAVACFLSESATSNPFYERLAGMIFGIMAGLPQTFFIRASFLSRPHRSGTPA
ncbi:MAG: hypothetical protein Q8Q59_11820 [Luteolibacter sp.]|jgi:hypothetical protein|nr:hypothetical protein [Luteolibacter sp.]